MKKNKIKKKVLPLFLACLTVIGASAWLTNKETQTGLNHIKPGTIGIEFVDTANEKTRAETKITLSGNEAIPMTPAYMINNLDPYKFSLENTGDIGLNYTVYLETDESTFEKSAVTVLLTSKMETKILETDEEGNPTSTITYFDETMASNNAGERVKLYTGHLNAGETVDYGELRLALSSSLTTEDCLDKTYTGHLVVEAEQDNKPKEYEYVFMVNGSTVGTSSGGGRTIKSMGPELSEFQTYINAGSFAKGGPHILWSEADGLIYAEYAQGTSSMDAVTLHTLYKDEQKTIKFTSSETVESGTLNLYY